MYQEFGLYSVSIAGGASVRLGGALSSGTSSYPASKPIVITPDSQTALFVSEELQAGVDQLFAAPVLGGPAIRLSDSPVPGGEVSRFVSLTPDGSSYVFQADLSVDETDELYYGKLDPDSDRDGVLSICDCSETNPGAATPGAVEINDGLDNQCPENRVSASSTR